MQENKLETTIVSMAMQQPVNTEVVDIKPVYFTIKHLAQLYSAISEKPTADIYMWYRIATNKYHFQGTINELIDISKFAITTSFFKQYAKDLHKDFLGRKVAEYANRFGRTHSKSDYEKLMQFSTAYEDIDLDRDNHGITSAVKKVQHRTKHATPAGLYTEYKQLDIMLGKGLTGDTLMTIGADSGVGKTALAVNLCSNIMDYAHEHKKPIMVDYFTEEMSNVTILNRFISCRTGVSDWQLLDPVVRVKSKDLLKSISDTAVEIKKEGLHTYEGFDLSQIVSTIRRHASQRKPNTYVAVIDHIGIVPVNNSARMPRRLQLGMVSRQLKELTTKFNIPIIMQSQINRNVKSRYGNELELSDLSESSAIAQDSNLVLLLYRDDKKDYNHRIIKIAKNRSGLSKKLPFSFYGSEMRFVEDDGEMKHHYKSK